MAARIFSHMACARTHTFPHTHTHACAHTHARSHAFSNTHMHTDACAHTRTVKFYVRMRRLDELAWCSYLSSQTLQRPLVEHKTLLLYLHHVPLPQTEIDTNRHFYLHACSLLTLLDLCFLRARWFSQHPSTDTIS